MPILDLLLISGVWGIPYAQACLNEAECERS
jgi:hypothetical protein